jgi:Fe2+ transport system protein FeoA
VRVIQHTPVTVVEVDQTEVALERDLARGIAVIAD